MKVVSCEPLIPVSKHVSDSDAKPPMPVLQSCGVGSDRIVSEKVTRIAWGSLPAESSGDRGIDWASIIDGTAPQSAVRAAMGTHYEAYVRTMPPRDSLLGEDFDPSKKY